jgi:hypothetical protein
MSSVRGLLAFVVVAAGMVVGACGGDTPPTTLQPGDFAKPEIEGKIFDRNNLVDPAAFTDADALDITAVQRFLAKTPYERPSFLETYQSNGVRAADAIISAARQYRINPLVFLVYAQITQGLLGERNYPFPPDRVEYVFRCGCLHAEACLPELAGFDRQLHCFARALRTAIDEVKANERTTSGWGPDVASTTLDNLKVTPANDVTAALYERTPRVNEGREGGTWIFWNVWQLYAARLEYTGPFGSTDGRWIGEACTTAAMCGAIENGICADHYPDGLCTVKCDGTCPIAPAKAESFCAKFPDGGYCLPICNPAAPSCRTGYECVRVVGVAAGESRHVCSSVSGTGG